MTKHSLGRLQEHDPLNFNFPAKVKATTLKTIEHQFHGEILDQGDLGSCTGNATVVALMCEPFYRAGRDLVEKDAVAIYEKATHLDRIPGAYPPDDTGSSGPSVAKAAREMEYCSAYTHAFGLTHTLLSLQTDPVMLGIPWYESMFETKNGIVPVDLDSNLAGGHEVCAVGYDADKKLVKFANSWTADWGQEGFGFFHVNDLKVLLSQGGDATILVP